MHLFVPSTLFTITNGLFDAFLPHLRARMHTRAVIGPCVGCFTTPEPFTVVGVHQLARIAGLAQTFWFSTLCESLRLQLGRD